MSRSSDLRIRFRPDRAAAIGVSCAPLIYFLPALIAGRVLCPWDGLVQNVPFRVAAAQMVRAGHLPFEIGMLGDKLRDLLEHDDSRVSSDRSDDADRSYFFFAEYLCSNRATRPPVSRIFCLPV